MRVRFPSIVPRLLAWASLFGWMLILGESLAADPPSANPQEGTGHPPEWLADLDDRRISESSGLASSYRQHDLLWTHNDSGDAPRLFAVNLAGHCLGAFPLRNARAIDWEDLASFELDGKPYLAVADTGNNQRRRKECQIYVIPEPRVGDRETVARTIRFRYPDEPQDCEALAYDASSRMFLLASKVFGFRTRIYGLAWPSEAPGGPGDQEVRTVEPLGVVPIPLVTAMDVARDHRHVALLSLFHVFEFPRNEGDGWKQAFLRVPKTFTVPTRHQGESLCYAADGKSVFLTSERLPTPLLQVRVPGE